MIRNFSPDLPLLAPILRQPSTKSLWPCGLGGICIAFPPISVWVNWVKQYFCILIDWLGFEALRLCRFF